MTYSIMSSKTVDTETDKSTATPFATHYSHPLKVNPLMRTAFKRQIQFCASVAECHHDALQFCLQVEDDCATVFKSNPEQYMRQLMNFCDLLKVSYRFAPLRFPQYKSVHFCFMSLLELVHVFLPTTHVLHQRITHATDLLAEENDSSSVEKNRTPPFMCEERVQASNNTDNIITDLAIHAMLRTKVYLDEPCPNCNKKTLIAITQQTRSGDEGQTLGKRCDNRTCEWSEISFD